MVTGPGAAGGHGYAPAIEPTLADADLVSAAQGGDRAALDALLRRHQDRIHALAGGSPGTRPTPSMPPRRR